jgi:hypothetical protein
MYVLGHPVGKQLKSEQRMSSQELSFLALGSCLGVFAYLIEVSRRIFLSSNEQINASWFAEVFVCQHDVLGNIPGAYVQLGVGLDTSNVRQDGTVKCGMPICVSRS